jgi:hypothetical protein
MGVLGFMMAFNVVYYQFSISAATIWFFCVPFTYYLVLDSRGDTLELHKALKYFKLEASAQGYGKYTNKQSNDFR